MWRGVGVVALSLLAAYWFCGTNSTQPSGQGDPAAERALVATTTGHFDPAYPQAVFPANWVAVMGYRPAVTIGPRGTPILYKTTGDCSSFTGETKYDFSIVCKEHDLSCDVVRYAGRIGQPLDASSRQADDDMFDRDLHARCDQLHVAGFDRGMCNTYASGFAVAVKLNSWRQGYRPPEQECVWRWVAMLLLFGCFVALPAGWRFLRHGPRPKPHQHSALLPGLPVTTVARLIPSRVTA